MSASAGCGRAAHQCYVRDGRVEDGRGSLGHAATLRFPSPLIEPDVRISRIRLSDWLHREIVDVVGRAPEEVRVVKLEVRRTEDVVPAFEAQKGSRKSSFRNVSFPKGVTVVGLN